MGRHRGWGWHLLAGPLLVVALGCGDRGEPGIVARGTVEVPEIDLAPLVAARVVSIAVDVGDSVAAGDTVAVLTQSELPAALAAEAARARSAEARLRDLEAGARPEEIRQAEAELEAAQAEAERTATERARIRALADGGAVSQQALDNAETAARVAGERQRAASEAVALLRAGTREARVRAARAELAAARAGLAMTEARAGDLVLVAPRAGRVLRRLAEPGEVVAPNAPVVTIGETGRGFVRVYFSARELARVQLGDSVAIAADGITAIHTRGRIAAINPQAEFTPRVALTEEERADLMFGVKVELEPVAGLHPGMWAVVRLPDTVGARRG